VSRAWRRLGRLALDTVHASWAATHAALPVVEALGRNQFAVYLSLRDRDGRARIGRTTLTMGDRPAFAPLDPEPVVDLGPLGTFDDSGVTTSCLVTTGRTRLLYYTGWSRGVTVPFYLAAGVVASEGGGPFERLSLAPLLDRTPVDPFLTASPFVLMDEGQWRMWYVSGSDWQPHSSGPRHRYNVRYAESKNGLVWRRKGTICLDYASSEEYAFARPWVIRDADAYRMWFAVRGDRYHIEHARSDDGITWTREPDAGLGPDGADWESSMVEYPCVFDWGGRRYMLYNGDGYGRSGVGLAMLDGEAGPLSRPRDER
jgi:hypothetical protein